MGVLLYNELRGKTAGAGHIEHIGFPLRCFADAGVFEGQRITRERRREGPEHQSCKILFQCDQPLLQRVHRWQAASTPIATRGWRRRRPAVASCGPANSSSPRQRKLNQGVADEAADRDIGVLRRNLVFPYVAIGQFAVQLEFDRNQVVPAKLPRSAVRHERPYPAEVFLAAQRRPRRRQHGARISRLATHHPWSDQDHCQDEYLPPSAH